MMKEKRFAWGVYRFVKEVVTSNIHLHRHRPSSSNFCVRTHRRPPSNGLRHTICVRRGVERLVRT